LNTTEFIAAALLEDEGRKDYPNLANIPGDARSSAILRVGEDGIIAGIEMAQEIFNYLDPGSVFKLYKYDGDKINTGQIAFAVTASVHTILKAEALVLRCMQRMSGIATLTARYVHAIRNYPARILDTRNTTPLFRRQEEDAVRIGGGVNHRMGEYEMVTLKGNLKDFGGGIKKSISQAKAYLLANNLKMKIEVETHTIDDVRRVVAAGGVHRVIMDNYHPDEIADAMKLIAGRYETEASGGITIENIEDYARTGVDYISVGAIIHSAVSMKMALKAKVL
jgi:nicotinate-nucleotide pyrophosphorylase (carboxylating)